MERRIGCATCQHQTFDVPRKSERAATPEIFQCCNCFQKR